MIKTLRIINLLIVSVILITVLVLILKFSNPQTAKQWMDKFNEVELTEIDREQLELDKAKHKLMRENFDRMYKD